MKMYTISELAALLDVNEETIRRWRIRGRNGVHLECLIGIGKQGHRVTSEALARFFEMNPGLCPPALAEELARANSGDPGTSYTVAAKVDSPERRPTPSESVEVILNIIRDKQEQRARLVEELQQIDREILVLQQQIEGK